MKKTNEKTKWKLSVQHFRDIHPAPFVETICSHGIGHHKGIHGCDGCCKDMPKELLKLVSKD